MLHPSHLSDELLLGSTGLGTLGSVFGATLCAVLHTCGIESAANDVIANTGEVLNTTAAHENDGVFLQVVAFSGDIGVDFLTVCEAYTSNFAHCRVRFLRCGGVDAHADAATLRAGVESGALALVFECQTAFTY